MEELNEVMTVPMVRQVVVRLNDDGTFEVQNMGVGSMETPTLLRLAAKAVEERLGL